MKQIHVHIARVERFSKFTELPEYAKKEIESTTNSSLIAQKKAAYGLLKHSLESLSLPYEPKTMFKDVRGKPRTKNGCFSFSHTNELVCVVVSNENIGVDIEQIKPHASFDRTKSHILSDGEEVTTLEEMTALWTKKEAIFKLDDSIPSYNPSKINTLKYQSKTVFLEESGKKYAVSVAAKDVSDVNFILDGERL